MKKFSLLAKKFFAKPEYVFIVPAFLFGLVTVFLTPQLLGNDEYAHFQRGYELTELEIGDWCSMPKDLSLQSISSRSNDHSFDMTQYKENDNETVLCGNASLYNPLMHIPQAIGMLVAKIFSPTAGWLVILGRFVNLIVYCAALFYIIKKIKIGKWVVVVIGLLPTMVHSAGTLSADVMNAVVLLGFTAYVFNLFVQTKVMSMKQVVVLLMLSSLLATTKMTNVVLLLPILFLPRRILPIIRTKKGDIPKVAVRFGLGAAAGVMALIMLFLWSTLHGGDTTGATTADNPVAKNPIYMINVLFNTYIDPTNSFGGLTSYGDWLIRGAVGSFTSFNYSLPFGVVLLVVALLAFILLRSDKFEDTKGLSVPLAVGSLGAFVIVILAMTYGLYSTWSILPDQLGPKASFAQGLQGRYFTPLLLFLLPASIYLRRFVSVNMKGEMTTGIVVFSVMSFALFFYSMQAVTFSMSLVG